MSFSTQDITRQWASLPASQIAVGVNDALHTNSSLVVTAPPGAGKSTLLPLTILSSLGEGEKILMLEPRRLAARQIAERMAQMLGEQVGETIGYRVRFESRVSKRTRIEVLTEGILTRMIVDDATLDGVSVVIFDEFHERSINSDLALALTRQAQQIIRPDLKVVIMSATIDTSNICAALQAPLIESEGRMFPVELHYADEDTDPRYIAAAAASTTIEAYKKYEGDILVFLPGQAEIEQCYELLSKSQHFTASPSQPINTSTHQHLTTSTSQPTTTTPHHLTIHPLYGNLSSEDQRRAIAPSAPGERKIVIATPIAETSITIEGVRVVIDAGLCRQVVFDARTGLSHLETVRISMDMATQRMGRAGRVAEGVCYRLWTKASEYLMAEQRKPEIEEADLAPMLLDTAAFGESDAEALPWLTMPPRAGVFKAKELLTALGAIDENGNITSIGKRMTTLPCHPRIARMILATTNLTTSTPQEVHLSPLGFCRLPEQEHITLTYGEIDTTKEKKKAEEPNIFTPHVENILLPMKTYASNVEFKQSNKSRDFINDEADDEQAEQQSYIKTGLLLHYLFSNIETADDVDSCLHDMEMEGLFDESVITPNKLKNMLHKRFSNPKVKEWFGGGWTLFNECSILSYDPHTDKLTEHRPDRVMKRGDEVQIVDFKFGKPQPEHTDQVRRYISLTHDMGYTDVKGYLWYVYSDNIVEV